MLVVEGFLLVMMGLYMGCFFNDCFVVCGGEIELLIDWGVVNKLIELEVFDCFFGMVVEFV